MINPYSITKKHPEFDIMHESAIIKTRETANISKTATIHCYKILF